jgi:polycystin 1L2
LNFYLDTCRIKSIIEPLVPTCYGEYSGSNEESGSFFPGWTTNGTIQNYSSSIKQAFIYQTGEQLGAYTYVGNFATYGSGGYVYEFRDSLSQMRNDLSQLHQLGWIDRQTRAVLIQMNLYNPNIPLYTSVVLIIEILPSSGIYPSSQFQPFIFNSKYSYFSSKLIKIFFF